MERIFFSFPGNEQLTEKLASGNKNNLGVMEMRRFPDGESYVRIVSDICAKHVVLVCTMDRPDEKLLPLYFFSRIARAMNAATITLVSPYLPYMRQDKIFRDGEGVTSVEFAKLLTDMVDEIVTVDPHLHRFHSLKELYSISTVVKSAAEPIAAWITTHVEKPFIIGPDSESEQWVQRVAQGCKAPFTFLTKTRLGDEHVQITVPDNLSLDGCRPVLVDDIISSGKTMIEAIFELKKRGVPLPVCIGVHGVFAGNSYEELKKAGATAIITTNSILHPSNQIDISDQLKLI